MRARLSTAYDRYRVMFGFDLSRTITSLRTAGILASGTVASQLLLIAVAPVLTRLYTSDDFGRLQVYISILSFAGVIAALRYEMAILLPRRDKVAANLVVVSLAAVLVMSMVCAVLTYVASELTSLPLNVSAIKNYFWLLPISMFGLGVYQTLSFWALRKKRYSQVAGTKLTQAVGQLGTQVLAGLFHGGPLGLMLGDAVGRTSGSLGLARLAWRRDKAQFFKVRLASIWNAATRYRRFPLISAGSALLNTAGFALPSLLIAQFYGAHILGWFALVERVMGMPSVVVGQAVSQVYMSEGAPLTHSDPVALKHLFFQNLKRLVWIGAVPSLLIMITGPNLFALVFGANWTEAGNYARFLMPMYFMGFIAWPLIPTLNMLELQSWQFYWDIFRLALTLAFLVTAYHLGASPRSVVLSYGAALFIGYALHLLLSYRAIARRIAIRAQQTNYQTGPTLS